MAGLKEFEVVYHFANGHKYEFTEYAENELELMEAFGDNDLIRTFANEEKHITFRMKDVMIIEVSPKAKPKGGVSSANAW